jgi:hypothetical protein
MSEGGRERRAGRESEGLDGGSIKLVYMANAASRVIYGSQGWRALSRRLIISRFHTYSSPIFQYPLFFSQSYTFPQPDRPRAKELPSGRGGPPVWAADCPGSGFALLFPHFSFPSRRLIKSRRHPWPRPESVPVLHPSPTIAPLSPTASPLPPPPSPRPSASLNTPFPLP